MGVFINGRFRAQTQTGVQRWGNGIVRHMPGAEILTPNHRGTLASNIWEQRKLPRLLKQADSPLLLNFCNTAPFQYANQIVTLHDAAVFRHPEWFSPAFVRWYRWLWPRIIKQARHIVTVSEFSRQELQELFLIPDDKISVIHPGMDEQLAACEPVKPKHTGDEKFLLMVGGASPGKNVNRVADAITLLLKDRNLKLMVVGSSSQVFSKGQKPSPQTHFTGQVNEAELAWLYSHCEAVIHASDYEGFSLVPLEAMHFGARVILSDIPVHREIYDQQAVFFAPSDGQAFCDQLSALLDTPKPATKETHASHYTYARAATQWREIIHKLEE